MKTNVEAIQALKNWDGEDAYELEDLLNSLADKPPSELHS